MGDINDTLNERGKRYGEFPNHAKVSQKIQEVMHIGYDRAHDTPFELLDDDVKESLFMIAHKLGRIINGDPYYADSWIDIAGYAKLVANRLEEDER